MFAVCGNCWARTMTPKLGKDGRTLCLKCKQEEQLARDVQHWVAVASSQRADHRMQVFTGPQEQLAYEILSQESSDDRA